MTDTGRRALTVFAFFIGVGVLTVALSVFGPPAEQMTIKGGPVFTASDFGDPVLSAMTFLAGMIAGAVTQGSYMEVRDD